MPIRIQSLPQMEQRIVMSKKEYKNTMLGLLVIFGITALFSIMTFFIAIIALCK